VSAETKSDLRDEPLVAGVHDRLGEAVAVQIRERGI